MPYVWLLILPKSYLCTEVLLQAPCVTSAQNVSFFALHPGVCVETNSQWTTEINRLQQLIDKLECKVSQGTELALGRTEILIHLDTFPPSFWLLIWAFRSGLKYSLVCTNTIPVLQIWFSLDVPESSFFFSSGLLLLLFVLHIKILKLGSPWCLFFQPHKDYFSVSQNPNIPLPGLQGLFFVTFLNMFTQSCIWTILIVTVPGQGTLGDGTMLKWKV